MGWDSSYLLMTHFDGLIRMVLDNLGFWALDDMII